MNQKGSVIDLMYIMVMFLVMGILLIIGAYLKDQIFPIFTQMLGGEAEAVMNTTAGAFSAMDNIFIVAFIMVNIAVVASAALAQTHPIFIVINIIMMLIMFVVAPVISNIMLEVWNVAELAPYAAGGTGSVTFPIITNMFKFLPFITAAISILLLVASFAKRGDW